LKKGPKDSVIVKIVRDGKNIFKINDYNKLRTLLGELLKEIQRINQKVILKQVKIF